MTHTEVDTASFEASSVGLTTGKASGLSRRALLTGGAVGAGLGTLLGAGAAFAGSAALGITGRSTGDDAGFGGDSLPCHGTHQPGILEVAANVRYVSYRLRPEVDRAGLTRLMRLLTGDIEALTSGLGALADPEPELAERPSNLTITVGVGPGFVDLVDPARRPAWLAPLPAFELDQLSGEYDGGDLLLIFQSDDQLPLAHAARMIHRDIGRFCEVAWVQQGFRQARGAAPSGTTMRNLMGQVDGTVNPEPGEEGFDSLIWLTNDDGQPWLTDGSAFVLRRIRMELDTWDMVDRPGREQSVGRTLFDGAPLTDPDGGEFAPVDFEAKNALGFTVIPAAAHIRRAHSVDPSERIVRRATNYDDGHEAGLLFGCYQRDPLRQFVPIQRRLDEADMLNEWVTHTGSAVFAMLPGFAPGTMLGEALLG